MKNLIIQTISFIQPQKLLFTVLLLGFSIIGLHAQDTLTDIIPSGSTIKKLSSNQYLFLEGPVWYADSVLLFVDDGMAGTGSDIYKYDPAGNQFSKWQTNSTHCTGLSCDKDGNLIGASLNVLMMNNAGQLMKTLASEYNGKPFNGPNDLIADDKGGVYFTDPVYFAEPSQDKVAVYYIDSTGTVTRIIDDLATPNGIILSPDGKKLYVVDSDNKYVYSWDVAADGTVSGKLSLAELQTTGGVASGADGMAIDINGNIYVATEKGIQIFSPQGAAITTIVLPETPSNCDFGGNDFKTLYITAHENDFSYSNLYSIDLNYPGYAVSRKTSPSGISVFPDRRSVEMYPNPVQNILHINLPLRTGTLEVFDNSGKSVFQKEIGDNNTTVDVSGLINGIYLVEVLADNQLYTGKIVKY
jgi:gluconolactonase